MYLEMNPSPPITEDDRVDETTDIPMKTVQAHPSRYKDHDIVARQMLFHYKLQQLRPVRATTSKDSGNFVLEKGANRENRFKAALQDEHKENPINFFNENNQATIQDVGEELVNKLLVLR
ncbi:hypothetical protein G6F43_006614 [Rhizopus delemar]|nr:hypothetical protein G6F43_006614 [Rhizopus delemar]